MANDISAEGAIHSLHHINTFACLKPRFQRLVYTRILIPGAMPQARMRTRRRRSTDRSLPASAKKPHIQFRTGKRSTHK